MQMDVHGLGSLERVLPSMERLMLDHTNETMRLLQDFSVAPLVSTLERLCHEGHAGKLRALTNFARDASGLSELQELLTDVKVQTAGFDLFQVIRPSLWEYEDVHSNIIAWLLDPQQNHNLGQCFLGKFLSRTASTAEALGMPTITPATIQQMDWSRTEIRREWRNIDILILNHEARVACAIENKINAHEGLDADGVSQLTRYRKTLEQEFPSFTTYLLFLDIKRGSPSDKERPFWVPENYSTVLDLVEGTLQDDSIALDEPVRVFLQQYANTLRRRFMPETQEIAELARQIYLKHRTAIELINKYKPDFAEETKSILREAIAQHKLLQFDSEGPNIIRVRSLDWGAFAAFRTGTAWNPSASVLTFEFDFRPQHPYLVLMLGPGTNAEVRSKIYVSAVEHPHLFRPTGQSLAVYTGLDRKGPILNDADYDNWADQEVIRAKVFAWVANFAENEFPAMNEVIVNCLREYEAEASNQ